MFILQVFMSFGWATGTISVLSLIILSMADSSQEIPVCCDIDNSCFLFLLFFCLNYFFFFQWLWSFFFSCSLHFSLSWFLLFMLLQEKRNEILFINADDLISCHVDARWEFLVGQCHVFKNLVAWNFSLHTSLLILFIIATLSIFFLMLILLCNRYVHAELHGASSTVIKNHRPEQPVPPLTLNQAGCFTVSLPFL